MALPAFLEKDTAGIPNWGWIAILVTGIGAAYVVPKFLGKQGTTAQTSTDQGSTNGIGLAVDPTTGLPYAVEGLVPGGGTAGTGPPSGTTNSPSIFQDIAAIRQRATSGPTAGWDKKYTGVPIRSDTTANGKELGIAGWGSYIKITGPAVSGGNNMGSTLWYPVTTSNGITGYISASDLSGISSNAQAGSMARSQLWPNG